MIDKGQFLLVITSVCCHLLHGDAFQKKCAHLRVKFFLLKTAFKNQCRKLLNIQQKFKNKTLLNFAMRSFFHVNSIYIVPTVEKW